MRKPKRILLLTLRTFSGTGGIEKVSKVAGKAIYDICQETNSSFEVSSMYDHIREVDEKYFPAAIFTGYGIKKGEFIYDSVRRGIGKSMVILSHVNLLPVGYLIKLFSPKTQLVLFTHGIEVWKIFTGLQKMMVRKVDTFLAVSKHTAEVVLENNKLDKAKVQVLNNSLDPYLPEPQKGDKTPELLKKYGFTCDDTIMLTLTRLASKERYKGYDRVIQVLSEMQNDFPQLRYMVVGKYDHEEEQRLMAMIQQFGIQDKVVFTGYVPDDLLAEYFNLADLYIMPSEKEGFGIVFIEALFYGKNVIAGNKDGSVDALLNGGLGTLIDPSDEKGLREAITALITQKPLPLPDRDLMMKHFSYPAYKEKWRAVLKAAMPD